jgi:Peptidase family M28/PA domain
LSSQEPRLDVSGPLVFVGYGIENELLGFNDYKGLDVKGKIVVALRGFPKGMPSEEGAHLSATKSKVAERHGAIGLVSVNTLQSAKTVPWPLLLRYAADPEFSWVGADGKAFEEAPGIRGRALLNTPPAATLFEGSGRKLEDILREADKPGATPRGFPLKTSIRIRSHGESARVTSPNVIGVLPGSDPRLASQYVVLSAHLDHIGISAKDPAHPDADLINNGALDNATGVATMLEVARLLAALPQRPRRTVMFIATTAEEKGLLGADYFARHPTVPIGSIVGNVDLDMPVLLYPFTDLIAFGANHSSLGPIVAQSVAPMGVKLSPDPMPEQGIFTRSDHYMFVRQGVPAVYLATGYANGGEKAWDSFYAGAYHHPDDDLRQAIDWQAGARFVEANFRITRAMADADQPPLWVQGDFFGDTFAPGAARAPRH